MTSLIWVNPESTVLVTRYENGSVIYVATREDSDALWGPPIACNADAETAKIMDFGRKVADAAQARMEQDAGNN